MLKETSENLKLGAIIRVDLGGALDGSRCICNGPLVLMHGDSGEIVWDSKFPVMTDRGPALVRKYVVAFSGLGGLRMLLAPKELELAFSLIEQGTKEMPITGGPVG